MQVKDSNVIDSPISGKDKPEDSCKLLETNVVPKLSVQQLEKNFTLSNGNKITAVRSVNFEVLENELCVLLGPSGCGKTTILRMIAGLVAPSSGQIKLDEEQIGRPDRNRGMVFQSYTSFEWLTVRRNVEYGMKLNGVDKTERKDRADHFIKLVGLSKFSDAYPSQLSGGMKQRVAIARTLANKPSLLLMDEPFGALDAETRWNMQELLITIIEETETTVVMVTHDIEEAIFLADRIVFLKSHPGTVEEIIIPNFKTNGRFLTKEALYEADGYVELEKHAMSLMRTFAHTD